MHDDFEPLVAFLKEKRITQPKIFLLYCSLRSSAIVSSLLYQSNIPDVRNILPMVKVLKMAKATNSFNDANRIRHYIYFYMPTVVYSKLTKNTCVLN